MIYREHGMILHVLSNLHFGDNITLPLFVKETDVIRVAICTEMRDRRWGDLMTPRDEEDCLHACLGDRALRERNKQALSEAISSRKRNSKDKLLEALGYTPLVSRMGCKRTTD